MGGEFDLKEQVFRDWGVALGPQGVITVVTRWAAQGEEGEAVEGMEGVVGGEEKPLVLLQDPRGAVACAEEITLEEGDQVWTVLVETYLMNYLSLTHHFVIHIFI